MRSDINKNLNKRWILKYFKESIKMLLNLNRSLKINLYIQKCFKNVKIQCQKISELTQNCPSLENNISLYSS